MESRWTPALGREVLLREGNSDQEVWDATFVHQYHIPPVDIQPKTVLDLGANIGLTAAHYAALWPDAKIVAVEMDEECIRLARVNAPSCGFVSCAVSGRGGPKAYDSVAWSSNFSLIPEGANFVYGDTLEAIIRNNFDGSVDFVKMDVEGAEWDILAHPYWADKVSSLLVELHGAADDWFLVEDAIEDLEDLGFTAVHHKIHPRAVWATR